MIFAKHTLALVAAVGFASKANAQDQSIYEIASSVPEFSTLTAAVDAAGLDGVLSGDGTFTVFAPPNAAFDALPDGVVAKLLKPEWIFQLQDMITYHALGSEVRSGDLSDGLEAETLNGETVVVNLDPPRVNENAEILIDAGLVDVEATNGVIHGVSNVLLPTSATSNIVDIAAGNPDFSTLVAAVQAAGLVDALSSDGPLTVFAPTNAAFEALPEGTVEALLADIPTLTEILTYHVVPGNAHSSTLAAGSVETLNGAPVEISTTDGGVMVNDANVVAADVLASNGIIHVLDKVILPPADDATEVPAPSPDTTSGAAGASATGLVIGALAGAAALLN
jgi:transforming growth factor-beta-induced protein